MIAPCQAIDWLYEAGCCHWHWAPSENLGSTSRGVCPPSPVTWSSVWAVFLSPHTWQCWSVLSPGWRPQFNKCPEFFKASLDAEKQLGSQDPAAYLRLSRTSEIIEKCKTEWRWFRCHVGPSIWILTILRVLFICTGHQKCCLAHPLSSVHKNPFVVLPHYLLLWYTP